MARRGARHAGRLIRAASIGMSFGFGDAVSGVVIALPW